MMPADLRAGSSAPHGSGAGGDWLRPSAGRLLVAVKVLPGASKTSIGGLRAGALLARIAAPAEKGKANEELIAALARRLGIAHSEVEIVSGALSRHKTLSVPLAAEPALRALCAQPLG